MCLPVLCLSFDYAGTHYQLADSPAHIVPGHDPRVLEEYPAAKPGLEDWIVRLDTQPVAGSR